MTIIERARMLRKIIERLAQNLDDDEALENMELYPEWQENIECIANEKYRFNEKLYRCVQSHTSQENWKPSTTPALWTEVAKQGEIAVWRQPTGAQDAYMTGDKVWYPEKNTIKYISIVDNNTWKPDVYGWNVIE